MGVLTSFLGKKNLVLVKDLLKYSPEQLSKNFGIKQNFAQNLINQAKRLSE